MAYPAQSQARPLRRKRTGMDRPNLQPLRNGSATFWAMPTSHIHVQRHFRTFDQAALFAKLAEHETMNELYSTKTVRVRDGDTSRNGVGSVRKVVALGGLLNLIETVTQYEPDHFMEYKLVSGGGPVRDHLGSTRITPAGDGGCDLQYDISITSPVPGVSKLVAVTMTSMIKKGLEKLEPTA